MISVFHNDNFLNYGLGKEKTLAGTVARLVARVATNSLDDAFRLTNNIDHAWIKNGLVNPVNVHGAARSTSVGDILLQDKTCFVVEMAGFRPLTKEEQARITFHTPA